MTQTLFSISVFYCCFPSAQSHHYFIPTGNFRGDQLIPAYFVSLLVFVVVEHNLSCVRQEIFKTIWRPVWWMLFSDVILSKGRNEFK